MAISKSLRFEVFARDGFACQYCGQRPPDVTLEVDHIHPVSKGGQDDSLNLITSCCDCNRGKSAKIISQVAPRPDADIAMLKVQQEGCEIARFLKAKAKRDKQIVLACKALQETWCKLLTPEIMPTERVLVPWIERYGPEEVMKSIAAAAPAYSKNRFGRNDEYAFDKLIPYIGGILRNRKEDRESGLIH